MEQGAVRLPKILVLTHLAYQQRAQSKLQACAGAVVILVQSSTGVGIARMPHTCVVPNQRLPPYRMSLPNRQALP